MEKIKVSFWNDDMNSFDNDEFMAIGFTSSSWGVAFVIDRNSNECVKLSWDELENLVGSSVYFTLSQF